jgi:hypothetical protein
MRALPSQLHGQLRKLIFMLAGFAFFLFAANQLAGMVLGGDTNGLLFLALIVVAGACVISMLNDWRTGTFVFFGWLFFEDLARKYLGNNMVIYFGKDFLVAIVYLSFFLAYRRKEIKLFRPPFLVPLLLFFWFGLLQVFNPASTSIFYGILGMKLYFYYVPLLYVGYGFVRSEEDLRKFYPFLMVIFIIIAGLGIVQSIAGPTFLNPSVLQEDIRELSTTYRVSPITGAIAYRPNGVFVSAGRFAFFLVPAWLFAFGFSGYLLLRSRKRRLLSLLAVGCISLAIVMCASRGTLMWTLGSAVVCVPALIWGCPWQKGQLVRVLRSFQRAAFVAIFAVLLMFLLYPDAVKAHFAIYEETLSPNSSANELVHRTQTYPLQQLGYAFTYPRWPYGYGIGTASLGIQYVMRIMHASYMGIAVESGYGILLLELGIVGLILYIILSVSIVVTAAKLAFKLKNTPWFPLAFCIFWYCCLFLIGYVWGGFQTFEDFILNSLLWFSLGILFRLPTLIMNAEGPVQSPPVPTRIRFPGMA